MSATTRLRLHYRILIPFALVALVTTAATAYVALSAATQAVETRVQGQIVNAAQLVGQGDFSLNSTILRSVKAIAGADVITFDDGGHVLASTLDQPDDALVQAVVAVRPDASVSADDRAVLRRIHCADGPCSVALRRVPARPNTTVAVVAATAELRAATRTVARALAFAAILSLTVMIGVSQLVARRVSAPLDDLVRFTNDIVDGASSKRAPTGVDEVGRVGVAFNEMLERLDRSQKALVQSEKLGLAGLIAARVAHDIRNPLSSIKIETQLLQARAKDDGDRKVLASILHDIGTVEAVIRDLLELSRPGAVSLKIEQLNDVVREVLDHLSPQLTYRKIRVETELTPSLPPMLLDAGRFKQALLNVMLNAADAMTAGGMLRVKTSAVDSTAVIDVCDDGVGIDPALLDKVFDPFVSTKRDGVGLGLVNTKAVVESHGGHVTLSRREPRGTMATIRLPIRTGEHG